MLKLVSTAVLSVASLLAVGCQSQADRQAKSPAMRSPSADLVCNKCGTTPMKRPVLNDKGHPIPGRYTEVKSKQGFCPDCVRMANGDMKPGATATCESCGGDVKVVASDAR